MLTFCESILYFIHNSHPTFITLTSVHLLLNKENEANIRRYSVLVNSFSKKIRSPFSRNIFYFYFSPFIHNLFYFVIFFRDLFVWHAIFSTVCDFNSFWSIFFFLFFFYFYWSDFLVFCIGSSKMKKEGKKENCGIEIEILLKMHLLIPFWNANIDLNFVREKRKEKKNTSWKRFIVLVFAV